MLDYIVINPYLAILQTPISHYCNTLQSPILQIAISYTAECSLLYCIILLTGVVKVRNRLPQVATGCSNLLPQLALNPPKIKENL